MIELNTRNSVKTNHLELIGPDYDKVTGCSDSNLRNRHTFYANEYYSTSVIHNSGTKHTAFPWANVCLAQNISGA